MSYEDLTVYKRAYQSALRIHKLLNGNDDLHDQIRRSSRSVAANIAEGYSRLNSEVEICRFLAIAIRSADEVKVWLDFCKDLEIMDADTALGLKSEYSEIGAMLVALWNSWKAKAQH